MPDKPFQTSLAIHRDAFARVATGLRVAEPALEKLRKAYSTADRQGLNSVDMNRRVAAAIGEFVWEWPWFEHAAVRLVSMGLLPLTWAQEGLAHPVQWAEVPHNMRVRFLTDTLNKTLWTTRDIKEFRAMIKDTPWYFVTLKNDDERCPATAVFVQRFRPVIEAGDYSNLPPFFPGDHSRIEFARRPR